MQLEPQVNEVLEVLQILATGKFTPIKWYLTKLRDILENVTLS
jgi:hypothetical protein